MSKKQFFLGVLVAALVGGVVAVAGVSFLVFPSLKKVQETQEEKCR